MRSDHLAIVEPPHLIQQGRFRVRERHGASGVVYVDDGETVDWRKVGKAIEDAVRRETREEAGIICGRVTYFASQPWPFPASLMLGFTAHALTTEVHLRDEELEDARWSTRADIAANGALLPPRQSISFRLIEHWFDADSDAPLRNIQGSAPWPPSR